MAEELRMLRTAFVDRVKQEIIEQLLDDLLDDKVLNSGEKDGILEGCNPNTKANRARKLIDTVRDKGDDASNRLLSHFQNRDPTLCKDLCQKCGIAVQPAVQEPLDQPDTSSSHRKLKKDDIYPVTSESVKNRVALLITNMTFANEKYNRRGAQKDEENMEKLLSSLKYEVIKYQDLTAEEMDQALVDFSKHRKLKETDSVFVVIMSHGKLGTVHGFNHAREKPDELPIDNIYNHLNTENCPELVDKPKIIIINACRGGEKGSVKMEMDNVEADAFPEEDIEEDVWLYEHKEKDFITLLSSTPHTVSYRNPVKGSRLIQYAVEVFEQYGHEDHIEELFRKIMKRFEGDKKQKTQMPTKDRCTLTGHFYFDPRKV